MSLVLLDDEELDALGQTDTRELAASVVAAIVAVGQRNAVDSVEKVPHGNVGL
jgi:hypothetical protein